MQKTLKNSNFSYDFRAKNSYKGEFHPIQVKFRKYSTHSHLTPHKTAKKHVFRTFFDQKTHIRGNSHGFLEFFRTSSLTLARATKSYKTYKNVRFLQEISPKNAYKEELPHFLQILPATHSSCRTRSLAAKISTKCYKIVRFLQEFSYMYEMPFQILQNPTHATPPRASFARDYNKLFTTIKSINRFALEITGSFLHFQQLYRRTTRKVRAIKASVARMPRT